MVARRLALAALRAFLPNRASAPALTKRPLADRRLHTDHVPDTRAGRRAVTTQRVQRARHALASGHLVIREIPNVLRTRWPHDRDQVHISHGIKGSDCKAAWKSRPAVWCIPDVIAPDSSIMPSVSTVR